MKFHLENIGSIKKADIELGDLTIISGKNNTGKTYVAYTIYGFLSLIRNNSQNDFIKYEKTIDLINNSFSITIDLNKKHNTPSFVSTSLSEYYTKNLHTIFNSTINAFAQSKVLADLTSITRNQKDFGDHPMHFFPFHVSYKENIFEIEYSFPNNKITEKAFNNKKLLNYINLSNYFTIPYPFIFTAERVSTHLFINEIDQYNADIINKVRRGEDVNIKEQLANYSLPIQNSFDYVRNINILKKQDSIIFKLKPHIITEIEELLGVKYIFVDDDVKIMIDNDIIDLHMTSTSVRALLDFYLYIRHRADENEVIIIDEPELNLHPENQIKLVKVFSKLINFGINIKVIITTHSDYITKEVNNLIALSNDFDTKKQVMEEYDYKEDEVLKPTQVKAYIAKDHTLEQIKIDNFGLEKTSFDETIDRINEVSEEIAFGING